VRLDVICPRGKLDPLKRPDETVAFLVDCVLEAERSNPGTAHGKERFELVVVYVKRNIKLPWFYRDYTARLVVSMVYCTTARGMPIHLRTTQPSLLRRGQG
jgi:hypothetical protein